MLNSLQPSWVAAISSRTPRTNRARRWYRSSSFFSLPLPNYGFFLDLPRELPWSWCHQTARPFRPSCGGPLPSSRTLPQFFDLSTPGMLPFSLPFSYLNGPSNLMASPFLSLFICSGHFLCRSTSATNPVILRPCHLQIYPSIISVSSVLLLYFLHLPSYTSAQTILLLL